MSIYRYQTLRNHVIGEYKEKGSKFIAYAYPVQNEKGAANQIGLVRKIHPKARHFCFAFRVMVDGEILERSNDDGEPSGTAGRPILGQLTRSGLCNIVTIVVRYFGGTKLGTSGLIRAYKTSTANALKHAGTIHVFRKEIYLVDLPYDLYPTFLDQLKKQKIEVLQEVFDDRALLRISIPLPDAGLLLKSILQKISNLDLLKLSDYYERLDMKCSFIETTDH